MLWTWAANLNPDIINLRCLKFDLDIRATELNWLFATPQTAAHQASLSSTNSQSLLKLMSIELVMPSNHLILCHPLLLPSIFPSIRVFSSGSVLRIRWPKYWNFSFNISLSNEFSGLISFRMDWLDLLQSKGLARVFSNTTVQKHAFFSAQPSLWSNSHIHIWLLKKTIASNKCTFVNKVMSLLFDTLSRFVIAFLPRSKHLLISWLQSQSAVILESKKIVCHSSHENNHSLYKKVLLLLHCKNLWYFWQWVCSSAKESKETISDDHLFFHFSHCHMKNIQIKAAGGSKAGRWDLSTVHVNCCNSQIAQDLDVCSF